MKYILKYVFSRSFRVKERRDLMRQGIGILILLVLGILADQ